MEFAFDVLRRIINYLFTPIEKQIRESMSFSMTRDQHVSGTLCGDPMLHARKFCFQLLSVQVDVIVIEEIANIIIYSRPYIKINKSHS